MKQLTAKETCALLGISRATLGRRMVTGEVKFIKLPHKRQSLLFIFAEPDDVLPAPKPVPQPEPAKTAPVKPLIPDSPIETKMADDMMFAERYVAGRASDSLGNKIDGTNDRRPTRGTVSLIGPQESRIRHRPDTASHMVPALVGNADTPHNPVDSDEFMELLHPGHMERIAAMYKGDGLKQPSEQERKQVTDIRVIREASPTYLR